MLTVAVQPIVEIDRLECPKCKNREGIKDGGISLNRHRAYDILSDSFGLHRCPKCRHRGHRSEFTKQVKL